MIKDFLKPADILLIVPPFMLPDSQSLAIHILQACAREAGFSAEIFYANMHYAAYIGDDYEKLCGMSYDLLGERLFSRAAYDCSGRSCINENIYNLSSVYGREKAEKISEPISFYGQFDYVDIAELKTIEKKTGIWVDEISKEIAALSYKIVGCTSSYEQTNASFSLLKGIKKYNSGTTTLIGGYNCEGECADGIASLDPDKKVIDHIFSGESETVFVDFLNKSLRNSIKTDRIIRGEPVSDMDSIPMVDYSAYFTQLDQMLPLYRKNNKISLSYETSRGCWWGQKKQCRFCGYADRMRFRQKSESKILDEIKHLESYNVKHIDMADLAMPLNYFETLLPHLENKDLIIYYEQRASLNYKRLKSLKKAGITHIQPGLETLSDRILHSVQKGNTVKSNISFLRNATSLDMNVYWNFLWGIPGEEKEEYEKIVGLIPLLTHMIPPLAMFHMGIVRFCPYFNHPEKFGIRSKYPLPAYSEIYPEQTDINKIALFFIGDYDAGTYENPEIIKELNNSLKQWNNLWSVSLLRPRLHLHRKDENNYELLDTRNIPETRDKHIINKNIAGEILKNSKYDNSEIQNWAVENKLAVVYENQYTSLITAEPEVLEEFGIN